MRLRLARQTPRACQDLSEGRSLKAPHVSRLGNHFSFDEGRYYIGFAKDVQHRLEEHNAGKNPSTAPFAPWSVGANRQLSLEKESARIRKVLESRLR